MQKQPNRHESKFRVPHVSGKYIIPAMFIAALVIVLKVDPSYFSSILKAEGVPMVIFWFIAAIVAILSFVKDFSLIPVLGFTSCFYLMAQESHTNWLRFVIWLVIGLVVYFTYGYKNSHLNKENTVSEPSL